MNRKDRHRVRRPRPVPRPDRLGTWGVLLAVLLAPVAPTPARAGTEPPATAPASALSVAEQIIRVLDGDAQGRRRAAGGILSTGTDEGVAALVNVLNLTNNDRAKQAICEASAETGIRPPAFREPLLALTHHTDPVLVAAAVNALQGYDDPDIIERVRAIKEKQSRAELVARIVELSRRLYEQTSEDERPVLLERWLRDQVLPEQRSIALDIIHQELRHHEPAENVVGQIRAMLDDEEPTVLHKAIIVLRDLRQLKDAAHLRALLEKPQPEAIRGAIYNALGYLADPESIDVCATALLEDPDDAVAAHAATTLGLLAGHNPGPPEALRQRAVEALIERAERPMDNPRLRESVIEAMVRIADPTCLPTLVRRTGPEETVLAIRQTAIRGIGQMGDAGHLPLLGQIVAQDQDARVREAAAEAIGRLGTRPADLDPLRERLTDPSEVVQRAAWEAYQVIFQRLSSDAQRAALQSWRNDAPAEAARRVVLLEHIDTRLRTDETAGPRRAALREEIGDALLAIGRTADATTSFVRALDKLPADQTEPRARVVTKLVQAYLRLQELEKAVTMAAELPEGPVRDAAAARLLAFAEQNREQHPEVVRGFLTLLDELAPDRFGGGWPAQFDAVQATLPPPETQPVQETATAPAD